MTVQVISGNSHVCNSYHGGRTGSKINRNTSPKIAYDPGHVGPPDARVPLTGTSAKPFVSWTPGLCLIKPPIGDSTTVVLGLFLDELVLRSILIQALGSGWLIGVCPWVGRVRNRRGETHIPPPSHSQAHHEYKPLTSKMANLDATTPQSKVIKGIVDAFATRDLNNLEPILSKDLVFKTFPKVAEHPDLTKAQYLRMYGAMDALFARAEVRTKYL